MEDNEIREEMDVVATEIFAVTEDLINSNEAMKAEILANVQDLVKEVQDANFDTQQSIDALKETLAGAPAPAAPKAEPAAPCKETSFDELGPARAAEETGHAQRGGGSHRSHCGDHRSLRLTA